MSDAQDLIRKLLVSTSPNCVVPPSTPLDEFSGLAFVGIAPAEKEVELGEPFVGPSGRVLDGCLFMAGINRKASWIGNLCPVRLQSDRGLSKWEVDILREPLIEALQKLKPKVVVTLGAEPTRALLNVPDVQIMLMRSHVYEVPELPGTKIIPSIHPSFALRQSLALVALLVSDLMIAKKVLKGEERYKPWTYTEIKTIDELRQVLESHRGQKMCLDTEATSQHPQIAELFMISFAFEDNLDHGYVIHTPTKHFGSNAELPGPPELLDGRNHPTPREDVLAVFKEYDYDTIIFNMLYDYIVLGRCGYEPRVFVDPMYAFGSLDEECPKSLDVLGSFFSGIAPYTMDYKSTDVSQWLPYSACDAVNTNRVWQSIAPRFKEKAKDFVLFKYLMPLLKKLAETSMYGCYVDLSRLDVVDEKIGRDIATKISMLHGVAGYEFNHRSNDQLAVVFQKLGIPTIGKTKKTGKPSFRKELLEKLADRFPFVALIRETKSLEKTYSSYIKNIRKHLDAHSRVHTNFDIKKTGRLSAREPALQTLPRDSVILELFAARPGCVLIKCDFSAAEMRWLGFLAGEKKWLNPFLDIHRSNASFFYQVPVDQVTDTMRQEVKFLGFGKVYGSGIQTLAKQLGCSEQEAAQREDRFFETFPNVKKFMEAQKDRVLNMGFVTNYFGLERHFHYDVNFGVEQDKARAVREAYNFGPQSATAMWTNMSLMKIQEWFENHLPNSRVVLQIHDAVVAEVPIEDLFTAAHAIWKIMRRPVDRKTGFFVPADVSIGPNLLHQAKVIPFYVTNFEEAWDAYMAKMKTEVEDGNREGSESSILLPVPEVSQSDDG